MKPDQVIAYVINPKLRSEADGVIKFGDNATIHICPPYFRILEMFGRKLSIGIRAPKIYQSKVGTILHETSHIIMHTRDLMYDMDNCLGWSDYANSPAGPNQAGRGESALIVFPDLIQQSLLKKFEGHPDGISYSRTDSNGVKVGDVTMSLMPLF